MNYTAPEDRKYTIGYRKDGKKVCTTFTDALELRTYVDITQDQWGSWALLERAALSHLKGGEHWWAMDASDGGILISQRFASRKRAKWAWLTGAEMKWLEV